MPPASHPSTAGSDKLDRSIVVIASVVIVGSIMSILDATIVNVALATLARDLDASLVTIQWVATGYLVALATVIPLTGWASERFGAKQLWMTVVALFVLGSALSGLAWSAESLIVFRVLQGLGGGMIIPAGMTILAQAAGPQRIGRVMSIVGGPMLLGPVLGPVLGGIILEHFSWRWIFYVNLPIGVMAFTLAWRLLPRSAPRAGERLDALGLALLSPGAALVVFGLSETSSHGGLAAPEAWGPIIAGLALLVLFARHALTTHRRPLLDLRLFRHASFTTAAATIFCLGAALFGSLVLLPLYLQIARGIGTLETGLLLVPQGVAAALVMPLSGRLTDRIGGGRVALFGLAVLTLATVPFTFLGPDTSYWLFGGTLFARGIGLGCSMMPAMAAAYTHIAHAEIPQATTALNVLQRIGGAAGVALLTVVLGSHIANAVPSTAATGGDSAIGAISPAIRTQIAGPLSSAFASTFWWAVILTALAIPAALVLARHPPARHDGAGTEPDPALEDPAAQLPATAG